MATKAKKAAPQKGKATQSKAGAGPAVAARSKDAKKTFGRAAPKTVNPAAAKKPAGKTAKPAADANARPSVAKRVARKVAKTATGAVTGAVALAASVIGKNDKPAKAKGK